VQCHTNVTLQYKHVDFIDNQPIIELITGKPSGIYATLDEELRMPKGSDDTFLVRSAKSCCAISCCSCFLFLFCSVALDEEVRTPKGSDDTFLVRSHVTRPSRVVVCCICSCSHKFHDDYACNVTLQMKLHDTHDKRSRVYKKPIKTGHKCFCVKHYAGEVEYTVERFLEKNRDTLTLDLLEMLQVSAITPVLSNQSLLTFALQRCKYARSVNHYLPLLSKHSPHLFPSFVCQPTGVDGAVSANAVPARGAGHRPQGVVVETIPETAE
jgi:hypothetical protein